MSLSGNAGLTEEYLYSQIQDVDEKKYRILTSSVDREPIQYTHRCHHPKNAAKLISVIEGKPIIHVIRIGAAGNVAYFDKGDFTLSENAYILYLKDHLPFDVNLKWLMYTLTSQFLESANVAEYGTWNKTNFFDNTRIDIPDYQKQNEVVHMYEQLESQETKLTGVDRKVQNLIVRQIAIVS